VAIWHAVEGDWRPPLSGPRDRFESTGTRVFRAANGSLSALPQGVSAGGGNWTLEAPEEVARPAFFLVRRRVPRRTASPRSRICSAFIRAMRSRATSAASSPLRTAS